MINICDGKTIQRGTHILWVNKSHCVQTRQSLLNKNTVTNDFGNSFVHR